MATRRRAKGRIGGEGERFARIPTRVLLSEAVKTLNHAAFKVLVVLASDCYKFNNGRLALTEKYARKFGFSGRDTLYKSLKALEERGLIKCTRRGSKIKNHFSLFAIGWEPIYSIDGQPLDVPRPASSAWERWEAPSVPGNAAAQSAVRADARPVAVTDAVGNSYRSSGVVGPGPRDE